MLSPRRISKVILNFYKKAKERKIENSFSEYNDIHDFISFSIYGFSSPRNPSKEADAEIPSFPTPITGPHIIPIESGKWNFYMKSGCERGGSV